LIFVFCPFCLCTSQAKGPSFEVTATWGAGGFFPLPPQFFLGKKMFKLMLVRFDRDSSRFEDDEFNKFCAEQNIVRIEKEFINSNGEIYYSFFIEYHSRKAGYEKPDMAKLSEREQEQYNRYGIGAMSWQLMKGFQHISSCTIPRYMR
jgi:hypothetical protein